MPHKNTVYTEMYNFIVLLFFWQRTTLILLCEDGSLRIYMANVENTGFWMSPSMQPSNAISVLKPSKKKKVTKTGKSKYHYDL